MREKILNGCNSIPVKNHVNYLKRRIVSLSELINAGLPDYKVQQILLMMAAEDDLSWNDAKRQDTLEAYCQYVNDYPEGNHNGEAKSKIEGFDDFIWNITINNINESSLNNYLSKFPNGNHVSECENCLRDLPWIKAQEDNTIVAYEEYKRNYPGKHTSDIDERINDLKDKMDWDNACTMNNTDAYRRYSNCHKNGKYYETAQSRIQDSAVRDKFLEELMKDANYHAAQIIQEKVNNGVINWDDIYNVFGEDKKEAIRRFKLPTPLPENEPPTKLQPNSTEVYFWGTPSSGKTCSLGSILSNAQHLGLLEKMGCSGYDYMTKLSNIFQETGFCTFPDSTSVENIQEIIIKLRDKNKKQHKLTLIDLAGELFRSVYFKQHGLFLSQEKKDTLDIALNYLKDSRNEKIHFFVVEYGAHDKEWEGLRMLNYLDDMALFLKEEKIFKKSTVGVYVLVTKCDKIPCAVEDRPRMAFEYVRQKMPAFWVNLEETCKKANVGDLKVLSFSVGDVFAQNLCEFNGSDSIKVVEKLITKTNAEGGLADWFRQ